MLPEVDNPAIVINRTTKINVKVAFRFLADHTIVVTEIRKPSRWDGSRKSPWDRKFDFGK